MLLWLHTEKDPPQKEWDAAIAELVALKGRLGGDLSRLRSLVISDGGAPNATQRGQLFIDVFGGKHKTSVITVVLNNPIKRGIITAISWINPGLRAVMPSKAPLALAHIDLDGELPGLLPDFAKLQAALPKIHTLELLAPAPQPGTA